MGGRMMRPAAVLALACAIAAAHAEDAKKVTIDWIFGDEGDSLVALPSAFWASDGSLLLRDRGKPKAEQTIERLRPESLVRSPAVDAKAALDSLRSLLAKDAPDALSWPASLDAAGRRGVYVYGGDLF